MHSSAQYIAPQGKQIYPEPGKSVKAQLSREMIKLLEATWKAASLKCEGYIWKYKIKLWRYERRIRAHIFGILRHRNVIRNRLSELSRIEVPKVDVCFDLQSVKDASEQSECELSVRSVDYIDRKIAKSANTANVLVVHSSGWKESALLAAHRQALADIVVVWMWDNHHSYVNNYNLASAADVFFPAHGYCSDYLNNPYSLNGGALPAACRQWSVGEAREWYGKHCRIPRKDELYGGFVEYANLGVERTSLVKDCIDTFERHALSLRTPEKMQEEYFPRADEERFVEWMEHKVSLALPIDRDIPCRVFDALVSGQIPIVPTKIEGFDDLISRELQDSLPVFRLESDSPVEIWEIYQKALCAYDSEGLEGGKRRHLYALENHMMVHRMGEIVRKLKGMGRSVSAPPD